MIRSIALIFLLLGAQSGTARAEPVTIVALGDSLTQGYGLREANGFVPQLADWLKENSRQSGTVRLINAGVSGDTTAGGVARIDWTLTDDVDGLIVALGGNDLLRGIDPASSRANLERILQTTTAKGIPVLLVGLVATQNMGPDFKAEFDQMYPELSAKYDTLYVHDFFIGLLQEDGTVDRDAVRARMQLDGIHPNKEGVKDIVKGLGAEVLNLIDLARLRGE
ncbi:arylesterase [Planktotalea sp.]|uniref:arylesterase n=1 Tax=Planktotalea sp. TaxID=2029877 RepID=UPI0025FB70FB|nr:arylesterase [Planktotalea sp.]